jgi:UDP-N-acetylmuramoyl-L-alanyl-D-glutamate--2,6-diaminopimelate ligase
MLAGSSLPQAIHSVERATKLPGTQTRIHAGQSFSVIVDRAATPERAHTVLQAVRSETRGRLWCVAGCPDHASLASAYGHHLERWAHHAILTAQSGRKRTFLRDAHHVLDGVRKPGAVRLVTEREAAILWAVTHAQSSDTLLVLADPMSGQPAADRHRAWEQTMTQVTSLLATHCADESSALRA